MSKRNKFDYFDAFIAQAHTARDESVALLEVLENFQPKDPEWFSAKCEQLREIEHKGDALLSEIIDRLAVEFLPPIEREDVTELAMLLDGVTDKIEEVMQHLYMFAIDDLIEGVIPMARLIDESVEALSEATKVFREFKKPKKLGKLLEAVHDKETEADYLYIEKKRDLFINHCDESAAFLVGWNSLLTHMEDCCDVCENVASVMQKIMLKNS